MAELTHFDDFGGSRMVDTSEKSDTHRMASASAVVRMQASTLTLIRDRAVSKGDVLAVARLAGIMAAKKTSDLIPLCHPLYLNGVSIDFNEDGPDQLKVLATVKSFGKTGVEMEALTAVSIAALTIYDMCKGVDRGMSVRRIQLEEKLGGKSGHYRADASEQEA
jgi:cyclic pyranopterin phosphate synthase